MLGIDWMPSEHVGDCVPNGRPTGSTTTPMAESHHGNKYIDTIQHDRHTPIQGCVAWYGALSWGRTPMWGVFGKGTIHTNTSGRLGYHGAKSLGGRLAPTTFTRILIFIYAILCDEIVEGRRNGIAGAKAPQGLTHPSHGTHVSKKGI